MVVVAAVAVVVIVVVAVVVLLCVSNVNTIFECQADCAKGEKVQQVINFMKLHTTKTTMQHLHTDGITSPKWTGNQIIDKKLLDMIKNTNRPSMFAHCSSSK